MVEELLRVGLDINVRTARGTALHEAALCGKVIDTDTMKLANGQNILRSIESLPKLARALCQGKMFSNWNKKDGDIFIFIFPPQIEVVKTLLSRGINPLLKDQHDR